VHDGKTWIGFPDEQRTDVTTHQHLYSSNVVFRFDATMFEPSSLVTKVVKEHVYKLQIAFTCILNHVWKGLSPRYANHT
jgi:hypothetical protein